LIARITDKSIGLILLMVMLVAAGIFLIHSTWAVSYPYPLDYGEAPLVDQAVRLGSGENIYRPDLSTPPYTISNYPPLYVSVLIPFVKLIGPTFHAGRVISVLSALASATFLSLIINSQTRNRLASVITGLFLLANPYVTHWSGLLRIDLLALAFSTAALYLLIKGSSSNRGVFAGAVLLVAAIYTRQSYALAAPLAAFVMLWFQHAPLGSAHSSPGASTRFVGLNLPPSRRRAIELALIVGGLVLILFLFLNILTDGGFYFNVVTANVNEFDLEQLEWHLGKLQDMAPVLLAIGGLFLLFGHWGIRFWPFLASYSIGAVLASLTIGKIGSNVNYFLELSAALSLVAGTAIAWADKRRWIRPILFALLSLQAALFIQTTLDDYVDGLLDRREVENEIRELEGIVAGIEGTILGDEYMGLITLQQRPLYIQPFEVTQLANAAIWDQMPFVNQIEDKEFPLILIHHFPDFPVYEQRWTPEMLTAIDANYILAHELGNTYVYRARGYRANLSVQPFACPGAPWQLPTSGSVGVQRGEGGLYIYGWGNEGTIPVYAVADGLLTRYTDWVDAVVIQHEDPHKPGEDVWLYYTDMASASGLVSYVDEAFPPGSTELPVRAGQLLGYQGVWNGRPGWGIPTHVRLALTHEVPGNIDQVNRGLKADADLEPYFGISLNGDDGSTFLQKLRCNDDNGHEDNGHKDNG
jgi:hypothetical protein